MRPVRTPPAHPSAARARGLSRIPRLPRARRYPRMPGLPPVPTGKTLSEDAAAPLGVHLQASRRGCRGSDRWPRPPSRDRGHRGCLGHLEGRRGASGSLEPLGGLGRQGTLETRVSLETLETRVSLESLGSMGSVGILGHLRGPWRHWRPRTPRTPWSPGCPWRPRTPRDPRGRRGASEGPGAYNCKNGFQNMFLNHRFQKKSRKSYQNFRNNSKSQTMKSAQDFFYRFWDRAIMTQSIIAVFTNRGGTSAQYRTKKVSHN